MRCRRREACSSAAAGLPLACATTIGTVSPPGRPPCACEGRHDGGFRVAGESETFKCFSCPYLSVVLTALIPVGRRLGVRESAGLDCVRRVASRGVHHTRATRREPIVHQTRATRREPLTRPRGGGGRRGGGGGGQRACSGRAERRGAAAHGGLRGAGGSARPARAGPLHPRGEGRGERVASGQGQGSHAGYGLSRSQGVGGGNETRASAATVNVRTQEAIEVRRPSAEGESARQGARRPRLRAAGTGQRRRL